MEIGETAMLKYEDLEAWQHAQKLVKRVYELARTPEFAHDFGVTGQVQRASVAIMSNVAEGFERGHLQEKLQFYNAAQASTGEVRSLLYVIQDNFPDHGETVVSISPSPISYLR